MRTPLMHPPYTPCTDERAVSPPVGVDPGGGPFHPPLARGPQRAAWGSTPNPGGIFTKMNGSGGAHDLTDAVAGGLELHPAMGETAIVAGQFLTD